MKKTILILVIISTIISCSNDNDSFSSSNMADKACECFNKQTSGTIDERLEPCLSQPINDNQDKIHNEFYSNLSKQEAMNKYMMETMIVMIHQCDTYYNELDQMFTNMYPEVDYNEIKAEIEFLQDSIITLTDSDSIKLNLMHEKVALLTKSRELEYALSEIDIIDKEYSESETYFIKAYIYRLQGKYELALEEINKYIKDGNEGSLFYAEMIKKKLTER